jgi:hypothetical protein
VDSKVWPFKKLKKTLFKFKNSNFLCFHSVKNSLLKENKSPLKGTHACNPTHKTENGTAIRWELLNRKPPGRIIMIGQSKNME